MDYGFEGLGKRRTLTGILKGHYGHHLIVEGSGERWEIETERPHRRLIGKRVTVTGWEAGAQRMIVIEMKLAE